jgi:hypothetical protein
MKLNKTNLILINSIMIISNQKHLNFKREDIEKLSKNKAMELLTKIRV